MPGLSKRAHFVFVHEGHHVGFDLRMAVDVNLASTSRLQTAPVFLKRITVVGSRASKPPRPVALITADVILMPFSRLLELMICYHSSKAKGLGICPLS